MQCWATREKCEPNHAGGRAHWLEITTLETLKIKLRSRLRVRGSQDTGSGNLFIVLPKTMDLHTQPGIKTHWVCSWLCSVLTFPILTQMKEFSSHLSALDYWPPTNQDDLIDLCCIILFPFRSGVQLIETLIALEMSLDEVFGSLATSLTAIMRSDLNRVRCRLTA